MVATPELFREVLSRALSADHHLAVVGDASSEEDVVILLNRTAPRVVLLDYEALGPNCENVVSRLRSQFPDTRVLVLATRSGPETVEKVLHAGASGLVAKQSDLKTVVRAVHAVAAGEVWANRRVTAQALERLTGGRSVATNGVLTERETEIVRLVGQGLRNKEIARRLHIEERTVKTHLNNVFRKLRVKSRVAVALLIQPKS